MGLGCGLVGWWWYVVVVCGGGGSGGSGGSVCSLVIVGRWVKDGHGEKK